MDRAFSTTATDYGTSGQWQIPLGLSFLIRESGAEPAPGFPRVGCREPLSP